MEEDQMDRSRSSSPLLVPERARDATPESGTETDEGAPQSKRARVSEENVEEGVANGNPNLEDLDETQEFFIQIVGEDGEDYDGHGVEGHDGQGVDGRDGQGVDGRDGQGVEDHDDQGVEAHDDQGVEAHDDQGVEDHDDQGAEAHDEQEIEENDGQGIEENEEEGNGEQLNNERQEDKNFQGEEHSVERTISFEIDGVTSSVVLRDDEDCMGIFQEATTGDQVSSPDVPGWNQVIGHVPNSEPVSTGQPQGPHPCSSRDAPAYFMNKADPINLEDPNLLQLSMEQLQKEEQRLRAVNALLKNEGDNQAELNDEDDHGIISELTRTVIQLEAIAIFSPVSTRLLTLDGQAVFVCFLKIMREFNDFDYLPFPSLHTGVGYNRQAAENEAARIAMRYVMEFMYSEQENAALDESNQEEGDHDVIEIESGEDEEDDENVNKFGRVMKVKMFGRVEEEEEDDDVIVIESSEDEGGDTNVNESIEEEEDDTDVNQAGQDGEADVNVKKRGRVEEEYDVIVIESSDDEADGTNVNEAGQDGDGEVNEKESGEDEEEEEDVNMEGIDKYEKQDANMKESGKDENNANVMENGEDEKNNEEVSGEDANGKDMCKEKKDNGKQADFKNKKDDGNPLKNGEVKKNKANGINSTNEEEESNVMENGEEKMDSVKATDSGDQEEDDKGKKRGEN